MSNRMATISRETRETKVRVELNLDGKGRFDIVTGIGMLNHLLSHIARHGIFDLVVKAEGDLNVDQHHTVEDIGICLGQALRQATQERPGVRRYGRAVVPMDETLAQVTVDLSNRPLLVYQVNFA